MPGWVCIINCSPNLFMELPQLLTHRRNWRMHLNLSDTSCYPPFVSIGTSQRNRMLPLRFQGLALPNPNIDALSKKFYLLQLHWDTGSTSGWMLHQAYQVFQVKVGLGGNIFPNPLSLLADLPPMGSFVISGNSFIDMESCFFFTVTLISRFYGNRTAP
jgi:hypothetical protein